ncbi:MAG: DUF445 family protein [Bacillota bacterium]
MIDSVFIISPLVGSLIGYCTNWLAIKMLFRPLTKKEILGFEIPFTPGVIPRRRGELAESIGNTVGKRLLTADAFEKILQGPVMKSKVKQFIRDKIKNLEKESKSLEEMLKKMFSTAEQVEKIKGLIKKIVIKNIDSFLNSKQVVEVITSKLSSQQLAAELENYFSSSNYEDLKEQALEFVQQDTIQEMLVQKLKVYLEQELAAVNSDKKIKDVIPEEFIVSIKKWLKKQKPLIMEQLTEFLDSDDLKKQIEIKVEDFFNNNPMLAMLSGFKDKIVEKFLNYLVSFVEEEDNQEKIMEQIEQLVDSILDTKVVTISKELDESKLEIISERIVKQVIKKENVEQFITISKEKILEKVESSQFAHKLELVILKVIRSELVINMVKDVVSFKVEQLFTTPLSDFFSGLSSELVEQLEKGIVDIIEYIMEHHLGAVFASLDFKNLVKQKINSFDVLEVERLLLDVIETELKSITWFGAVLGFLLGLITPAISFL